MGYTSEKMNEGQRKLVQFPASRIGERGCLSAPSSPGRLAHRARLLDTCVRGILGKRTRIAKETIRPELHKPNPANDLWHDVR
jgi:hypothetical protein